MEDIARFIGGRWPEIGGIVAIVVLLYTLVKKLGVNHVVLGGKTWWIGWRLKDTDKK